MNEPLTDSVLVERAKRGDEIAFSELVTRHYRRAMRIAYGLLHNSQDAEDVVQEAFARVYLHLRDFERTSAFFTWLYRIVVNVSIDTMRRQQRRGGPLAQANFETTETDQALWPDCNAAHPEKFTERREMRHALHNALNGLPKIHQAVVLLREVEGMSYDEIAYTLRIKKGTVMSRLFHARKALQKCLLKNGDGSKEADPIKRSS